MTPPPVSHAGSQVDASTEVTAPRLSADGPVTVTAPVTATVDPIRLIVVATLGDNGAVHRSSSEIAGAIGRLISTQALAPGTALPTVRRLARALDVSPTTVSDAWRTLIRAGAIETHGRNGSTVSERQRRWPPSRYRMVSAGPGNFTLDLSAGIPDNSLLPPIEPFVARVSRLALTSTYLDPPVLPRLRERLVDDWPFEPDDLTVVDGALDAVDRVMRILVQLGDRVVVADPTFPPVLDMLERRGCEVVGVRVDEHGMRPDEFAAAMQREPSVVFVQPRAHNPTGVSLTAERARELASLIAPTRAVVVEDDHAFAIAGAPLHSLGTYLPDRTIHVRSFSKSHGPDLRLAAVGGAGDIITELDARRMLGPGWSSRILQAVLVEMLDDASACEMVAVAADAYQRRRDAISAALASFDIAHFRGHGINLWLPVQDQQAASVTLASNGIGVAPGRPFTVNSANDHVRVTVGLIPDSELERVGDLLARAAAPSAGGRTR